MDATLSKRCGASEMGLLAAAPARHPTSSRSSRCAPEARTQARSMRREGPRTHAEMKRRRECIASKTRLSSSPAQAEASVQPLRGASPGKGPTCFCPRTKNPCMRSLKTSRAAAVVQQPSSAMLPTKRASSPCSMPPRAPSVPWMFPSRTRALLPFRGSRIWRRQTGTGSWRSIQRVFFYARRRRSRACANIAVAVA